MISFNQPNDFTVKTDYSSYLQTTTTTTINYEYDPLYRLTSADYSNGDSYLYTYDAVGNRLTETTQSSVNSYQYDSANRLTNVNGTNYTFDDNGNLLSDGTNTYTYDSANRLITVSGQSFTVNYAYNGLGDRYTQTMNNQTTTYVLDLNAGLTQVLDDGTNTYTYGLGRISQTNVTTEYFLGDALGSVRQMTNNAGEITLVNSYEPYGNTVSIFGTGESAYGFTGETTDANGLIYLRARYYSPVDARFMSRDTWVGNEYQPITYNKWTYANANPIVFTDPSGYCAVFSNDVDGGCRWSIPLIGIGGFPSTEIVIDFSGTPLCNDRVMNQKDELPSEEQCETFKYDYDGILVKQFLVLAAINTIVDQMLEARDKLKWDMYYSQYISKILELEALEDEALRLYQKAKEAKCDVKDWPLPTVPHPNPPPPPPTNDNNNNIPPSFPNIG